MGKYMIYPNSGKVSRTFIEATYVGTCSRIHVPSLRRYLHGYAQQVGYVIIKGTQALPYIHGRLTSRGPQYGLVCYIVRGQASNQANFGNAGLRGGEGGPRRGGRERRVEGLFGDAEVFDAKPILEPVT